MHITWYPLLLTLSQALLAGALPRPHFRQSHNLPHQLDLHCNDVDPSNGILTCSIIGADVLAADTSSTTGSSPIPSTSIAESSSSTPTPTSTNTLVAVPPESSSSGGTQSQGGGAVLADANSSTGTDGTSTAYTSAVTIADGNLGIEVVTSTDLPDTQTPTATSATQSSPDTTGSIITTLETGGNPPVQPFPTSIPTVSSSTLQPLNTTAPFNNATTPSSQSAVTETVTLPLTTFETVVVTQTVTTVPVETTATVTAVTVQNATVTSNGSTFVTSSAGTTVLTTTGTALGETTLSASSTVTATVATTVTVSGQMSTLATANPTACTISMGCSGQDLFLPVAVGQPPSNIEQRSGHPVPRQGIVNTTSPIETNKFYANFFLGSQGSPTLTVPYGLTWSKGSGNAQSWGMSISHVDDNQKVYGPQNSQIPNSPNSYYINPLGIQSIILSAAEIGSNTVLTSDSLQQFSANIHLQPSEGSSSSITFPLVQGMGFVTALYNSLQPAVQSSIFFRSVASAGSPKTGIFKYRLTLEDGKIWLLYAIPDNGMDPNFQLVSSTLMQGLPNWSGQLQVAKNPAGSSESIYDAAAGVYATTGSVAGYAQDSQAQYSLSWTKGGAYAENSTLLMFALPHHMQSFDSTTQNKTTSLQLDTTTKGTATAVAADCWVMEESELPTTMGFAPWRPGNDQNVTALSATAIAAIQSVSAVEASQNMSAQTNLNSMYYSGKGLSKFAQLVYTMNDLAGQPNLAAAALAELKSCFNVFSNNQQQYPLLYDTDWKGMVSSASYVTGDSGVDFGNSFYNDHHFHYGYFIHAAAVIGYLDPSWLAQNKDYINALVRDVSNPSSLDQYFPLFRSFDWYHGHSWAHGLYESGDGKDEESSSEDAMFAYGLKMWGKTVGDASMEGRGNLMLSVLARSLQNYFLLEQSNQNQPAQFVGNKVTGIMFENKVDHTTYFGSNFEYIQGIHMIPLMPYSTLTRNQQFVAEEWATYFVDGGPAPVDSVQGGWRGILYANLANINPTAAYNFFSQADFDPSWLDGGASRSWYLALSAMLGGAP